MTLPTPLEVHASAQSGSARVDGLLHAVDLPEPDPDAPWTHLAGADLGAQECASARIVVYSGSADVRVRDAATGETETASAVSGESTITLTGRGFTRPVLEARRANASTPTRLTGVLRS